MWGTRNWHLTPIEFGGSIPKELRLEFDESWVWSTKGVTPLLTSLRNWKELRGDYPHRRETRRLGLSDTGSPMEVPLGEALHLTHWGEPSLSKIHLFGIKFGTPHPLEGGILSCTWNCGAPKKSRGEDIRGGPSTK